MKIFIIHTTTNSKIIARHIADNTIKKKLSPCVQIIPQIESNYKWHGKIKISKEFLIIIKTFKENVDQCKKCILELHNYDIPEIIVTESKIIMDEYKDWFNENCSK